MKKVAIIGAGISGLFIANLFKKNSNYQIKIFEKNTLISLEEGYGIQLSVNSIKLLNEIGFEKLQNNEKFTPEKINFYSNINFNKICELKISDFNSEDSKYTTLKRSTLINFLKKNLENVIKVGYNISKIEQKEKKIWLSFANDEIEDCDYLIISDGVFSKTRSLVSKDIIKPKYNDTLAIRGKLTNFTKKIDSKNISLFLASNFHQVIYPINKYGDLNFVAIMKYHLNADEQKNYSLFNESNFIKKILEKIPSNNKNFINNLKEIKIFPVFVSSNFYKSDNKNIHLIGDAFFAFPPSFAQGASQSLEGAYELFKSIQNNTENEFLKKRVRKIRMVNTRSKINQFVFHLTNPMGTFLRNFFLKKLIKNRKFLETYLGKIYNN